jgi:hypothetical protein
MKTNTKQRNLITVMMTVIIAMVIVYVYPHASSTHYKYEEGKPWNYAQLIAPFDIPIKTDSLTVAAKLDSLSRVYVPVYSRVDVSVDSIVKTAFDRMDSVTVIADIFSARRTPFYNAFSRTLKECYAVGIVNDSTARGGNSKPSIRVIKDGVVSTIPLSRLMSRRQVYQRLDSVAVAHSCRDLLANADVQTLLVPSLVYDENWNSRFIESERSKITVDHGVIQRGQTIINKGDMITAQAYTNLKTYEQMLVDQSGENNRNRFLSAIGQFFFVAMLLAALLLYIMYYEEKIFKNLKNITFILIEIGVFVILGAVLENLFPTMGIYILPLAVIPILTVVFFNGRIALWTSLIATLLCAAMTTFPLEFILLQFSACSAAVFSLRDLTQRTQLLRTSLFIFTGYLLAYFSLQIMMNGSFDDFSWRMMACMAANAILTSISYAIMAFIERVFGFVSNVTLVEIADVNTPLMRKLSDECPGTFQHSMAVSTLAADAASRIGANTLLVRAGALYHDIGKLSNPVFFTENQHGVNPHDGLTPMKSAEIIINHVSDGLARAEKAKLPAVIRDFISEHHGAGTAKYFYYTYCKQHPDEQVDPRPFTYPGPNPRSRETSVLMMADAVEAASRSLKEHTPKAISDLVDKLIDGQIADGLHNDSSISFSDVKNIKDAFKKRLMTMYHSRISYPDDPNKDKKPQ